MNKFVKIPPVRAGDQIDIIPFTVGSKGDPIAKYDGYVIILKSDVPLGEEIKVNITCVYSNFCLAEKA